MSQPRDTSPALGPCSSCRYFKAYAKRWPTRGVDGECRKRSPRVVGDDPHAAETLYPQVALTGGCGKHAAAGRDAHASTAGVST